KTRELSLQRASHELMTPITNIMGWCKVFDTKNIKPQDLTRALVSIRRNAELQNHLIGDLLEVCRLTSGKIELKKQPVNVSPVMSEFIESFDPVFKSKDIDLKYVVEIGRASCR